MIVQCASIFGATLTILVGNTDVNYRLCHRGLLPQEFLKVAVISDALRWHKR